MVSDMDPLLQMRQLRNILCACAAIVSHMTEGLLLIKTRPPTDSDDKQKFRFVVGMNRNTEALILKQTSLNN